ncbi:MAG: hypothetical protein JSR33_09215 [Proteobacteria bacterium]|nr:hypothetical protein [Pseudomonadota bacterium]
MNQLNNSYWRPILTVIAFFAIVSLYFTIFLPYMTEEGRYSLASLEMYFTHYFWQPTNYGHFYGRPPFYNWVSLPLMYWLGPQQVLVAGRIVAASASALMGLVLWFFAFRLYKNALFALFTVALFFSGDMLFRRSWVAAPDTLFALCTFTGIAAMWLSVKENRAIYWLLVPFTLFAAMLSKALTAYVFYFTALLVIWIASEHKSNLFKPASILAHIAILILPLLWFMLLPNSRWHDMLGDISSRAVNHSFSLLRYLEKLLFSTFDVILRLAPVDLLAFYCWYRYPSDHKPIKELTWICILSFLPYWLSTAYLAPRYLLPILPFAAIIFGYYIWNAGIKMIRITIIVLAIELLCKTIGSFVGLPWFESVYYNQQTVAQDILKRTQGQSLYTVDLGNGFGIAISSYIDALIWPQHPLLAAPDSSFSGCVISNSPQTSYGRLLQTYTIHTHKDFFIYLYCK